MITINSVPMKTISVIMCFLFMSSCHSLTEKKEGFLFFANIAEEDSVAWIINSIENKMSIDRYNYLNLVDLNLNEYKCIESNEDKDFLFALITYTEWMFDSIADADEGGMTQNYENWFWFTNKLFKDKYALYSIGKVDFDKNFESYLFAIRSSDMCHDSILLYCINVSNGFVVSVVQLNNRFASFCGDYGDFKTDVSYQSRRRRCVLQSTRSSHFVKEKHKSRESTLFNFSSEGRIIWSNN